MSTNDYRKCAKCGRTRAEDKFVSYHRFPNPGKDNISKALAWAKYCWPNKDWTHASLLSLHTTNKVLCGRHFALSQFYDNKQQKLSKFAVPDSAEVEEFLNKRQNIFKQTHELYHPNPYQQHCQLFTEQSKTPTLLDIQNNHFEAVTAPHHVVSTQPDCVQAHPEPQSLTPAVEKKTMLNKSSVDTSTFSIEERLVTAVWVHERKHTKNSMSQIKHDFRQRFGRDPPAKNTLLVWERKLFSTGSVHDAPRPGRPVNRHARMEDVKASVRAAPALSLRARALSLRVPRTTLRTILRRDLPHAPPRARETAHLAAAGKQQIKRNVKRKLQSQRELGAGAGAEPRSGYT